MQPGEVCQKVRRGKTNCGHLTESIFYIRASWIRIDMFIWSYWIFDIILFIYTYDKAVSWAESVFNFTYWIFVMLCLMIF